MEILTRRIFLILGIFCPFSVDSFKFSIEPNPLLDEITKSVSGIVKDWNSKHKDMRNDVSILNLQNDTSVLQAVVNAVSGENAVFLPENNCNSDFYKYFGTSQSAFLIVVADLIPDKVKKTFFIYFCADSVWLVV